MNLKTIGTTEILAGVLLTLLTLITGGGPRIELYIVGAALFISGHVLVAAVWRQGRPIHNHDDSAALGYSSRP